MTDISDEYHRDYRQLPALLPQHRRTGGQHDGGGEGGELNATVETQIFNIPPVARLTQMQPADTGFRREATLVSGVVVAVSVARKTE